MSGDVKLNLDELAQGMNGLNEEQAGRVMVRMKDFLAGAVFSETRTAEARAKAEVGA